MSGRTINIRSVQHYMYCPRRFALLENNSDWAENAFVVKADIMHENVHSGAHSFSDSKKQVFSSVAVYNDLPEYDIYGIADCIEFVRNAKGTEISGLGGRYNVRIVEYKPKRPKSEDFHQSDAIQVFAQKLCADHVWNCDSEAYIYYDDVRRRVKLPFDNEREKYDQMLKGYLKSMRELLDSGEIPKREKGQKCSGCSLSDICFPKVRSYSVRSIIESMNGVMPQN